MGLFGKPENKTTEADLLRTLRQIQDPDLHKDIVSLGFVKEAKITGDTASIVIELTTPACPVRDQIKEDAKRLIGSLPGIKNVDIRMTAQVRAAASPAKEKFLPKVKNIIPVASGKGGVGKSTVSVNLALALAKTGAKVGLMDADVYGPSVPTIMGITEKPKQVNNRLVPVEKYEVKVISMGFLVPSTEAVIWRGPMLHQMVQNFLGGVEWGELDYLVVDLPPGTGDIQLSLCQMIPITGAAIVSTPQDVAWNVAQKAILMFNKLNTPVLGVIENMSHFICGHCGQKEEIFGSGGARKSAEEWGIPFLGEIPLVTSIRETSDQGNPIVQSDPDHPVAKTFLKIAENLAAQISIRNIQGETKIVPIKIGPPNQPQVEIEWSDGHKSIYPARELRLTCPCAECVNEITGQRRLNPGSVPADVRATAFNTIGRYALQIVWSDGHSTGLYGFENLRKDCSCHVCKG
jgi:ATP-binding protein involved in chromosome partitioning